MFKFLRKKLNLRQHELAEMLDVSVATLSRWENYKATPMLTFDQIKRFSKILSTLGLTVDDLPSDYEDELEFFDTINSITAP